MSLKEALTQEEFVGLTDSATVAKFDEDTELSRDQTPYTWSSVNRKLLSKGILVGDVAVWNEPLQQLTGGPMLDKMLTGPGVDLSLPEVQGMIGAAVGDGDSGMDDILNALLQIGIKTGKRYEYYGLETLPTEAEVTAARAANQNSADVAELFNELLYPLQADGSTVADIKTAVANWSV